jgi:hypothetical protein
MKATSTAPFISTIVSSASEEMEKREKDDCGRF